MQVKVNVRLGVNDMYEFLMYHTYFSLLGVVGLLISICAFAAVILKWNALSIQNIVVLLIAGLLFTVVQPYILYCKAKKQINSNKSLFTDIFYMFDGEGIHVSQGEEKVDLNWEEVSKVTSTKRSVLVYLAKTRAFIIPKESLGEDYAAFKEVITENAKTNKIRMK